MPLPALRIAPERQLPGAAPRPGSVASGVPGWFPLLLQEVVQGFIRGRQSQNAAAGESTEQPPPRPRRRGGGRGPGGGRDARGRAVPGPPVAHGCARRGGGPLRTWGPALLCEGCLGLPLPQGRTPHGSEPAQAALQLAVSPYGPL